MALDSPEERRARDEALGVDVEAREEALVAAGGGEAVETYRPTSYGRRTDQRGALVASAARINLKDRRSIESLRKRRQAWQTEAWDYFDEVGEIGYTTTYIANLMSKLRLYPAIEGEDGPVAVSVLFDPETDSEEEGDEHRNAVKTVREAGITDEYAQLAIDTLRRLRSQQGGQSALLRELSLNLEVAGECYVHGHAEQADDEDPGGDLGTVYDDVEDDYDPTIIEDWNVRSVDELVVVGDEFQLRRGPGMTLGQRLPDGDLVIRLWERHPRFSEMATCAMRRVLAEAEALLLLSREIRATSKSRLSNGILLIPSELSFGSIDPTHDGGDGEETEDPFDSELQEAMITPIQEEGSASAVVPLVLRGPAELLQHVNHLALDKSLDPVLDARIEQRILRIARGLNMPTEVTTGLMATTFANAVQVKRSEFEDHIEPRAVLVCDAITSGYFQWALEVDGGPASPGMPAEIARKLFIWFDASALIRVEDQSEQAVKAHEDGVISDAARRKYTGFKEEDAPDAHELAMRILLRGGRIDPTIFGYLLRAALDDEQLPVPAPAAGVLGVPQSVSALPVPGAPPQEPVDVGGETVEPPPPPPEPPAPPAGAPAPPQPPPPAPPTDGTPVAASAARGDWARLGDTLAGVDRELRGRIIGKLDQAMLNALERAGVRINARLRRNSHAALREVADTKPPHLVAAALGREVVAAAGLTDDELLSHAFDTALESVRAWLWAAYERAIGAVERTAGQLDEATRQSVDARVAAGCDAAVVFLRANLHELAAARLYRPVPSAPEAGEYDGTVLIPASMVRVAIAIAGGEAPRGGSVVASAWVEMGGAGPVTTADGSPLGGIGTGPAVMGAVGGAGGQAEGWKWDYGQGARSEFPPHVALDGTVVARTDDPAWANQGTFPATDYYYPGDHDGCVCDIVPVIVDAASGTDLGTQLPTAADVEAESGPGGMLETADETATAEGVDGFAASLSDRGYWADLAGLEDLDPAVAGEMTAVVNDVLDRFPVLTDGYDAGNGPWRFGGIGTSSSDTAPGIVQREIDNAWAITRSTSAREGSTAGPYIWLNADPRVAAAGSGMLGEIGFTVGKTASDALYHEFGHVIAMSNPMRESNFLNLVRSVREEVYATKRFSAIRMVGKDLGVYAMDTEGAEFYGEIFSVVNSPGLLATLPSQAARDRALRFAQLMNDRMAEYMRGRGQLPVRVI